MSLRDLADWDDYVSQKLDLNGPGTLPCPFCGERTYLADYDRGKKGVVNWVVQCGGCGAMGPCAPDSRPYTEDDCKIAFNKRRPL